MEIDENRWIINVKSSAGGDARVRVEKVSYARWQCCVITIGVL